MRAYGAFTRRMSGCVRRSPSRRPRAARPETVGDRCGPRVDRHQSKRQTRTAFRLPDATRDSFHEDDTPGAMRSKRRKETRVRCACEASNAPTMRVHRAGAASGLDQRAQRAKAVSECNERMQRAGRVCGCGERQDASGIEAQCATATRTPRCRRPHRSTELARFPPGGPPRFVAIGRGHFVRRGRRRAACRHTAPPTRRRPRRSDMSGAAPRRAPLIRGAGPSDDGQATDRQAAGTPSIDQPINRPTIAHDRLTIASRSPHDRPTRSASNRPACAIVHSKPRGRHG